MPPAPRLPAPRELAPRYPYDQLHPQEVRPRLARHLGLPPERLDDAQLAAVLRRIAEAQRQVRFLADTRRSRTMTELAGRVGVSTDTVERLMSGRSWPAADLVGLLAEELERPLAFTRDGFDVARGVSREVAEADLVRQAVLDASADAVIRRLRDDPELARRVAKMRAELRKK